MRYSEVEDHLAHHGVKGMKWGVRKDRGVDKSGSTRKERKKAKKQARSDSIEAARVRYTTAGEKREKAKQAYKNATTPEAKKKAKGVLRNVKAQNYLDATEASKFKDGKEYAAWVFGGELGRHAYIKRSANKK